MYSSSNDIIGIYLYVKMHLIKLKGQKMYKETSRIIIRIVLDVERKIQRINTVKFVFCSSCSCIRLKFAAYLINPNDAYKQFNVHVIELKFATNTANTEKPKKK